MPTIRNSGAGSHSSGLLPLRKRCSVFACVMFASLSAMSWGWSSGQKSAVRRCPPALVPTAVQLLKYTEGEGPEFEQLDFSSRSHFFALTAPSELGCGIRDLQIVHFSSPALWLNLSGHFNEYSFILALSHALYFQLLSLWLEFIWQRPGCSLLRGSV